MMGKTVIPSHAVILQHYENTLAVVLECRKVIIHLHLFCYFVLSQVAGSYPRSMSEREQGRVC